MKLKDAIEALEREPETMETNFKTKREFYGVVLGSGPDHFVITPEMLASNKWGISFRSSDKEFNKACRELLGELKK